MSRSVPPSPKALEARGWERRGRAGKCSARYFHRSGWEVLHCGHPTANWPYYALPPTGGEILAASAGRAFANLAEALAAVELRAAGHAGPGAGVLLDAGRDLARVTP